MKLFVRFVMSMWDFEYEFLIVWINEKLVKECDKFLVNMEEYVLSCIWIYSCFRFNIYIIY